MKRTLQGNVSRVGGGRVVIDLHGGATLTLEATVDEEQAMGRQLFEPVHVTVDVALAGEWDEFFDAQSIERTRDVVRALESAKNLTAALVEITDGRIVICAPRAGAEEEIVRHLDAWLEKNLVEKLVKRAEQAEVIGYQAFVAAQKLRAMVEAMAKTADAASEAARDLLAELAHDHALTKAMDAVQKKEAEAAPPDEGAES